MVYRSMMCGGVIGAVPETLATITATTTGRGSLAAITELQTSSTSTTASLTRGAGALRRRPRGQTPPASTSSTIEQMPASSKESIATKVGIAMGASLGVVLSTGSVAYIVLLRRRVHRAQRTLDRWGIEWKSELQGDTYLSSKSEGSSPVVVVEVGTRTQVAELECREKENPSGNFSGAVLEQSRRRVQNRWYELAS